MGQEVAVRDAIRSVLAALACHAPVSVSVPPVPLEGVVPFGTAPFCVPEPFSLGEVV